MGREIVMTKRLGVIAGFVYAAFLAEFVSFNVFGNWGKPELMLLIVVFCGLYWGIRYSLAAAFMAGIIRDSFGIEPFGTYILIYVVAAFLTTLIRRNLYQPGSRFSRAVVAFFVLACFFVMEVIMHLRLFDVRITEAIDYIFFPQVFSTMIIVTFLFHRLRDAAVRLKI